MRRSPRNPVFCLTVLALAWAAAAAPPAFGGKVTVEGLKIRLPDDVPLSDEEMLEAIEVDVQAFLKYGRKESCLEDAAYHLKVRFQEEGYAFAKVTHELAKNGLRVRFEVRTGPEVVLERIVFSGNNFLTQEELESHFRAESRLPLGFGEKRLYVRSRVESGTGVVRARYRAEGFLWVKAEVKEVVFTEKRDGATVFIDIAEGKRAFVSSVTFEGNTVNKGELLLPLGPVVERPYYPALPAVIRNRLTAYYADHGYPFARVLVEPAVDPARARVSVVVRVSEGPRVSVRQVRVKGNDLTRAGVIRYIAAFDENELFRLSRVREAITDLLKSGLFEYVDIQPERIPGEEDVVDLVIKVREADDFEVTLAVGAGTYEMLMAEVGISNQNIFGFGREVWLKGRASYRELSAEAGVFDPWVFYLPMSGTWTGYLRRRVETTFTELKSGMDFLFTLPFFDKRVKLKAGYSYQYSDILEAEEGIDISKARGLNISSVLLGIEWDGRDDRFNPRWGMLVKLSHEFAGRGLEGEVNFDRSVLRSALYATPFLGITWAVNGEAAIIDPKVGTDEIPPQLRFYRGGESSVRSFFERDLGPKNAAGYSLGGESYLQLNVEARIPLGTLLYRFFALFFPSVEEPAPRARGRRTARPEKKGTPLDFFAIAVFWDTGSLKARAAHWLRLEGFRHAVGVGLRLVTPIGPLRLDVGWNPDRRHGEEGWEIHFSVGHAF